MLLMILENRHHTAAPRVAHGTWIKSSASFQPAAS